MSLAALEGRFKAEQEQIDALKRLLGDLVGGQVDMAVDKYRRFAAAVASAKTFIDTIKTRTP